MINIVIPMAGEGSRFKQQGYITPKPFLEIDEKPMIRQVIDNVTPLEPHRFILLYRKEHLELIKEYLGGQDNIVCVQVNELTEGAACTVLLAEKLLSPNDQLMIVNSDQLVTWNDRESLVKVHHGLTSNLFFKEQNNVQDMINRARLNLCQGMIATFKATEKKWSFVRSRLDHYDVPLVELVAEKNPISNDATCGIYWYASAKLFINAARQMIEDNERVNNEFYVCPVYNKMMEINPTLRISHYPVRSMFGLGTPEDYEYFTENKLTDWYYGA